jgi:hypothetical protein
MIPASRGKVAVSGGPALVFALAVVLALAACARPVTGNSPVTGTRPTAGTRAGHGTSPAAATSSPARAGTATPQAPAISAGDEPDGFWYGTDSSYVAPAGADPASEPAIGGTYGGYIGMIGNWAGWQNCGGAVVWSSADSASARANFVTYHAGIGVAGYWFMAGPGVDPDYNGTIGEASAWGAAQAAEALSDLQHTPTGVNYPVIFMDVELPGDAPDYTPARDNGWNVVYTSACSGQVKHAYIPASVDRADLNGFADYLTAHSSYQAGVYSAPSIWTSIFGTSPSIAGLPNTYEWTYNGLTSSLSDRPDGWCLTGTSTCAEFFGGQTSSSKYALMWQWSGGGGTRNGYGDFDQIDASRTP